MSDLAEEIRVSIKNAPTKPLNGFNPERYMGTKHPYRGLTTKSKTDIAKSFYLKHPNLRFEDMIQVVTSLMRGISFEEKTIGSFLLNSYKQYASLITPDHIQTWLYSLEGWCEIDTLCQNRLNENILIVNWNLWNKALARFAKHTNINHRRASLVLLCKPLRQTSDIRIYNLAIQNVEILKQEKDILITKAISWVLRESTKHFKKDISEYLSLNSSSLPSIAVRETKRKITTGKK